MKIAGQHDVGGRSGDIEKTCTERIAIRFESDTTLNRAQRWDNLPVPEVLVRAIVEKRAGVDRDHVGIVRVLLADHHPGLDLPLLQAFEEEPGKPFGAAALVGGVDHQHLSDSADTR